MALLTESQLRNRGPSTLHKAETILLSEARTSPTTAYDIFLSHSINDASIILGLKSTIENQNLTVYVDWIDDNDLDRQKITTTNASVVRSRLEHARALLYAFSPNASRSRWMPWELGYADAKTRRVAIIPITRSLTRDFQGEEYLGLYPYVSEEPGERSETPLLWINETPTKYIALPAWINGKDPYVRT